MILNFLLFFIAVLAYQGSGSRINFLKSIASKKRVLSRYRLELNSSQDPTIIASETCNSQKKELNPVELCLCGAFATACGDFVTHPFDTIKITQQTASKYFQIFSFLLSYIIVVFKSAIAVGMIQTAKQIVATRGLSGLYQGVVPYLIGDGLSGAVKFGTFEMMNRYIDKNIPKKYHGTARILCAAIAMIASSVILVPAEIIKTRLQAGAVKKFINRFLICILGFYLIRHLL
jgi:hypothetical protein